MPPKVRGRLSSLAAGSNFPTYVEDDIKSLEENGKHMPMPSSIAATPYDYTFVDKDTLSNGFKHLRLMRIGIAYGSRRTSSTGSHEGLHNLGVL